MGVYLRDDGKRVCGAHARREAGRIVGRATEERRSIYRTKTLTNPDQTVNLLNLIGVQAMSFEVIAKESGEYNAEDYAPPGIYLATVESVKPYEGTKYMSNEPQTQARITWVVQDGPYAGKKAERLYSPSLNESSRLYPVFKTLTGVTPVPGQSYDIEALMVGRAGQIVVMEHTTQTGNTRTRVENVLPAPTAAPTAKRTKMVEIEVDDDM
jgi:hypothetical protein